MAMSHQANATHSTRSEDVRRRIFRSHLAYLNQEETPAKLDQRHSLEGLIIQFLSLVPHNEKFHSSDIAGILHRSVHDNPKFSAYKATSAFEALEKYATNLISHPWRKEYKVMKLYSGFYQHTVRSQLNGSEAVFYQLGYQLQEEGELFLDGPIDPDRVARVALDCLTACVECQVMFQICEKVKAYKCSWPEILYVREEYVCGVEGAVRILQLMKRTAVEEKQNRLFKSRETSLKDKQPCSEPASIQNQKTGLLVDVSNTWPSSVSSHPGYTEGTLLPHSSPQSVPCCPPKSGKGVLVSHSKSPSWSEGVTSHTDGYHQSRSSSSKLEHDQVTGLLDDHVKIGHTVTDSSQINSPRYSVNSDSLPDSRGESWEVLHSPVHKAQYQSNFTFSGGTQQMGYNPVPNVKMNYGPQYAQSFPAHMMPLGVPGYPYPIAHNMLFNSRQQCQCRPCIEQQQQLMMAGRLNNKDLAQSYSGPESNVHSRSDRHLPDEPFDINAALINLSLDGHNSGPKLGQFPLDNSSYMIHKTPSNPSRDGVTLRPNSSSKSQSSGKRGSYYDNVPSTSELEALPLISGTNMISKSEQSANGPVTLNTSSNKPRNSKGITSTDSAGNTMSRPFQQELLSAEPANCIGVQVHKYPNPSLSSDPPRTTKTLSSSSMQRNPKDGKRWSCQSCTFYNMADKRICDMCGRSRFPGPESMPLVSGGRECPQCTLVNRKDCEDCTACGASLKDSPTYI